MNKQAVIIFDEVNFRLSHINFNAFGRESNRNESIHYTNTKINSSAHITQAQTKSKSAQQKDNK